MFNRGKDKEDAMSHGNFVAVPMPSREEGIGRALQVAFRDGFDLPADMRACLDRLDRASA